MPRGPIQLIDAETGRPVAVRAARGLLRVHCLTRRGDAPFPADGVRALLVGDAVARIADAYAMPVELTCDVDAEIVADLADTLGIRPPGRPAEPGAPADVAVSAAGTPLADAAVRVRTGPLAVRTGGEPSGAAEVLAAAAAAGADPLALRLAVLRTPYREPVALSAEALEDARRALADWRARVAGWAEQPSRPVPGDALAALRAAWDDDLDLPSAIGVLAGAADGDAAPGALFELFAHADRVFALDLVRDVGRG